jgi:hypothetical protein
LRSDRSYQGAAGLMNQRRPRQMFAELIPIA